MKKVNCNLCGTDSRKQLIRLDKFNVPFEVTKCPECGLIYQNPRPDESEMASFYSDGYYTGQAQVAYAPEDSQHKAVARERLKFIEKMIAPGRVLDIGCHSGTFLETAKARGWECYGVDVSEFVVKQAKEKGIEVFCGEVVEAKFENDFFDLITMYEVIEHLFNPLETLKEIARVLKEKGLLIIQTANMNSLRVKFLQPKSFYYIPVHLYYFTKKTLAKMLNQAGLEVITIFNGSEFDIATEMELFRKEVALPRLLLRKLLKKIDIGGFTLNTAMVVHAKKSKKKLN